MSTVRVHLADAPTDVLGYLVGIQATDPRTTTEIVEAVAPLDAVEAGVTVARGLRTLIECGYVQAGRVDGRTVFWATIAGRLAVAEALAAADVVTASRTDRQPDAPLLSPTAPQAPAPTDLAASTPDPAVDVAGTTGPAS